MELNFRKMIKPVPGNNLQELNLIEPLTNYQYKAYRALLDLLSYPDPAFPTWNERLKGVTDIGKGTNWTRMISTAKSNICSKPAREAPLPTPRKAKKTKSSH